jgi:hypothetical protein
MYIQDRLESIIKQSTNTKSYRNWIPKLTFDTISDLIFQMLNSVINNFDCQFEMLMT